MELAYDQTTPALGTCPKIIKDKDLKRLFAYPCSEQHYSQQPKGENYTYPSTDKWVKCDMYSHKKK